jgi:hypothetical protein
MSKWLLLNQCFKEIHTASLGLNEASKDDPLYVKLRSHFNMTQLDIDNESYRKLQELGYQYKVYCAKALIMRFILANLSEKGWFQAINAIKYYKKRFAEEKTDLTNINTMIMDINRAFILYCLSNVNYFIMKGIEDRALQFARIATLDAVQLLDHSDPHYKQVELNLGYSF